MSHYAVAVIHRGKQDIDDLLEPYNENIKVEPYIRFTKPEAIAYVRENWAFCEGKSDEECYAQIAQDYEDEGLTGEDGSLYTTYNPDSKWDWYEVGGRFSDRLRLRNGLRCNSAFIRDVDFSLDRDVYNRALRFWDVAVEHAALKPGEQKADFWTFYNEQHYREYYLNRETYATILASFVPYAVVTPDGQWHAKGDMGWFGCSSETPEESLAWDKSFRKTFIDDAEEDLLITVVDCHI